MPSAEWTIERLDELAVADGPPRWHEDPVEEKWKLALLQTIPHRTAGRLLDVGAGSGAFVAAASRHGYEAEGHDLSKRAADAAAKRFGVTVHSTALDQLEGGYDLITMWDTLEHCADPISVLNAVSALLAPGGVVVVFSPNPLGLSGRLLGTRWWVFGPSDHLVLFSRKSLERAFAELGLRTIVSDTRHLAPPYPPERAGDHRVALRLFAMGDPLLRPLLRKAGLGDWTFVAARR